MNQGKFERILDDFRLALPKIVEGNDPFDFNSFRLFTAEIPMKPVTGDDFTERTWPS